MHKAAIAALCAVALGDVYGLSRVRKPDDAAPPAAAVPHAELAIASTLDLRELVATGPVLRTSDKARALAGHRVRMVGFMAQMELAPTGAFYLTARPTRCDEAGGGTADLPPESVLVTVRSAEAKQLPFVSGPIEVTGVLDIGNQSDAQGRISAFRIALDAPAKLELARRASNEVK